MKRELLSQIGVGNASVRFTRKPLTDHGDYPDFVDSYTFAISIWTKGELRVMIEAVDEQAAERIYDSLTGEDAIDIY